MKDDDLLKIINLNIILSYQKHYDINHLGEIVKVTFLPLAAFLR